MDAQAQSPSGEKHRPPHATTTEVTASAESSESARTPKISEQECKRLSDARLYKKPTTVSAEIRQLTDQQLVESYLAGNNEAFSEIITRHHRTLWWVARRYVNNDADAEDVLQEALFKASRKLIDYRGDSQLRTWLYRLVANAGYDYRHRVQKQEIADLDDPNFDIESAKHLSHDPFYQHADTMTVQQAVNSLAEEHKTAIILMDYHGYNLEQAAQIQGVKPGTVKSRRARARNQLREMLDQLAS